MAIRSGKVLRMLGGFLALLLVALLLYVRLAPSDPERWHRPIETATDTDLDGGAVRVIAGDEATLAQLDTAMRALPRTRLLAGSVGEGRITYVTRSKVVGFPDYTTMELQDGEVRLFARLRFGKSDLGVNRKRLEGLLGRIEGR